MARRSGEKGGSGGTQCWTEEVLNGTIRWSRTGLEYELDQRHAERIISELGLESCMPVSAPCVQESVSSTKSMLIESTKKDNTEARRLRALAARLNDLQADRPDLLFLSKCILERVRRRLKRATIMVQRFRWTGGDTNLQSWEDSDWAGVPSEPEVSTSGVIMRNGHCTKAWSTSQSALAVSWGERWWFGSVA